MVVLLELCFSGRFLGLRRAVSEPVLLKGCVIRSGVKWLQQTAFRTKWVASLIFLSAVDSFEVWFRLQSQDEVRKHSSSVNRWKFTEWSFIWKRRAGGRIKKLFLAFRNVYLVCVCIKYICVCNQTQKWKLYVFLPFIDRTLRHVLIWAFIIIM